MIPGWIEVKHNLINVNKIIDVYDNGNDGVKIIMDDDNVVYVSETLEEIKEKIREATLDFLDCMGN